VTGQAEQPDREVAQGGHDLGAGGGADAAGVFGEGDVADPVERFDLPVGTGQGTELLRAGVVSGLAAERLDEFVRALLPVRSVVCRCTTTCWVWGSSGRVDRRGLVGWGIPPRPPRCATST
jgi:hypothetical protein